MNTKVRRKRISSITVAKKMYAFMIVRFKELRVLTSLMKWYFNA